MTSKLTSFFQICASLPAAKPFFTQYIPRLFGGSDLTEVTNLHLADKPKEERVLSSTFGFPYSTPPLLLQTPNGESLERSFLNLNKDLPPIRTVGEGSSGLEHSPNVKSDVTQGVHSLLHAESVYDFRAYDDGHISVYKTSNQ